MGAAIDAGECEVWWARVGDSHPEALVAVLDPAERERWQRFRHGPSQALYALAHATARHVCGRLLGTEPGAVRFTATCRECGGPHGRPGVDLPTGRLCVSLSHSGRHAAVAVAWDTEIGVDLEEISLRFGDLPTIALAGAEREHLAGLPPADRLPAFIRYWTRKEATLKATGDGLLAGPERLTVSPPDAPPAVVEWDDRPPPDVPVFLADLRPPPGYHACLATLGRRLRVVERDAAPLLAGS